MTEEIQNKEASEALLVVEDLAERLGKAENILERGYAEFAAALLTVQENRFWESEFESWGQYMEHITSTYALGKAQLYHKLAVVRQLQGIVGPSDLTEMGISKASVLADVSRMNNGIVPNEAIEAAQNKNSTVKDLKKKVHEILHVPEPENGDWYDAGFAFYATPEEKQEIEDAMLAARRVDPVISNTLTDFMQRKEILLRFCRDFLATYTPDREVGF